MTEVVLSWSGGKDAAVALRALRDEDADVAELLTTVDAARDRSTMHGVRRELIDRQADAVGVPIRFVELPPDPSNEAYEAIMADVMEDYREKRIERFAFGDLRLEEVREYREARLADAGVEGVWPIWGQDTTALAEEVIDAEYRAIVVAVDGDALDGSFAGRSYDRTFLDDLPHGVDPCGENGEFHTFVWDGPPFSEPVAIERGETVTRDIGGRSFYYCDLLPADA